LEVANLDLRKSSDRRDRLTAVPHPPGNRLQVDEVTHTLAGCVHAHVFIHLIEAHTLPSVNGAQPLEQHTNRGGIVYVGTFKVRAFLVRPALRFHRTLARPQLPTSAHRRKRRTGRALSSTTAATFASN
jgi:hypothetical protein